MRLLTATLVLACLAGPPVAHAQRLPGEPIAPLRASLVAVPASPVPPAATAGHRTRAREGAVIGFVVGVTATVLVTRSGGSTAPCDRSANQDAMSSGECLGLAVAGGLVGAGVGALIGSRIRVSALQALPPPRTGPSRGSRLVIASAQFMVFGGD